MGRDDVSATWVLEQCLSKEVFQEYKRGIEVEESVDEAGWETGETATVTQRQPSLESAPTAKRSQITKWNTPQTSE